MADASQVLNLKPIFGIEARVIVSSASNDGEYVEMDCVVDPGRGTDPHIHPEQTELYEVLEGCLDVFAGGRWQSISPGQSFTVAPGMVHAFRNNSEVPVRFRNQHRPALRFQEHLQTIDRLVRAGKVRSLTDPRSLIYLCMSAVENEPDVPVKPPQWVIRSMAFLGRRLGYSLEADSSAGRPK